MEIRISYLFDLYNYVPYVDQEEHIRRERFGRLNEKLKELRKKRQRLNNELMEFREERKTLMKTVMELKEEILSMEIQRHRQTGMTIPKMGTLACSLLLLLMAAGTEGAITCEAVTTRYETSATCHFGMDINQTKHNINVQFYYPDFSAEPDTILMCNWMTSGDLRCREGKDIRFNYVISDQLIVTGAARPDKVGGKYVCQALPSKDMPFESCELTFSNATTSTSTTTTTIATTTTPAGKTESVILEEIRRISITVKILAGVVSVVVIPILVILIILIRHSRFQGEMKQQTQGPESSPEDSEEGSHTPLLPGPDQPAMDKWSSSGKTSTDPKGPNPDTRPQLAEKLVELLDQRDQEPGIVLNGSSVNGTRKDSKRGRNGKGKK